MTPNNDIFWPESYANDAKKILSIEKLKKNGTFYGHLAFCANINSVNGLTTMVVDDLQPAFQKKKKNNRLN